MENGLSGSGILDSDVTTKRTFDCHIDLIDGDVVYISFFDDDSNVRLTGTICLSQLEKAGIAVSASWFHCDIVESSGITSIRLRPFPIPTPSEFRKIRDRCKRLFTSLNKSKN